MRWALRGLGPRCETLACAWVTCCPGGLSGFELEQDSGAVLRIAGGWGWGWGRGSLRQLYRRPGRGGGHDQEVGVKVGHSREILDLFCRQVPWDFLREKRVMIHSEVVCLGVLDRCGCHGS